MSLAKQYTTEIAPKLQANLKLSNVFETPKLVKISVNVGLGEMKSNEPLQKSIQEGLALITGQKAVKTTAKKAIAGFKLRAGDTVGYRVTLRGDRMYDFLDRLITSVFPRIRDFQGFARTGFDGRGNYSFGLKDQMVFPELPYQTNAQTWSLQVTIVSTAKDTAGTNELLTLIGFPLAKETKTK
jgi:large subunit ribosomal protein L5